MAITISGNGITSANIADGTITNADINASAAIDASKLTGTGKVLQVIQTISTTQFNPSTSYGTFTNSTVNITPSSTSSKILISYNTGGLVQATSNLGARIKRDGTVVRQIDRYGYSTSTSWSSLPIFLHYLDSPSTTSQVSYTLELYKQVDTGAQFNDEGTTNGLVCIAMEIEG